MTSIVLANTDRLQREGLHALIERSDRFRLIGNASVTPDVHALVETSAVNIVVIDSGFEAYELIHWLSMHSPETRSVVIGPRPDFALLRAALCSGAHGYVLANDGFDKLLDTIQTVADGQTCISPNVSTGDVPAPLCAPLSDREWEVIGHMGAGKSIKTIASHLGVSPRTVDTYRNRIMEKLQLSSVAEIVRFSVCARVTQ
ncbi:MAG: response regulator transcription factor [Gammaproteobacteria bacterium]|nr:response regulator transcription factor [Gammaproteobacteria bacterium]MCP5135493.1 response regulator transcription factor [Gammaproteobacteria bacterium]